ncbi:MAG TPA: helix-turn-helix domain-containing protein [Actinomycetota bacterium]|nr:helix-turn-helix domain-containing protein [Microthrixaceae bacterium]HNK39144.1 helix-turn-helix domain-containing protein [Microthrixaceae bacterium]HUM86077.1 helix-turn-helix domain-containing protein [Actinomycetota bacterium]
MSAPDLLTVTEAAAVLRIGRTTAYELVRSDFASGGAEGLEVVRVGGQFRIPRVALERLVGGPVSWPADETPGNEPVELPEPAASDEPAVRPRAVGRKRGGSVSAPMLPFDE